MNVKPDFSLEAMESAGSVLRRAVDVYGVKIYIHPAELMWSLERGRSTVKLYKRNGQCIREKNRPNGFDQCIHVENIVNLEA